MRLDARVAALFIVFAAAPVLAAPKSVSPLQSYSGRIALDVQAPLQSSIGTANAFAAIWTLCKVSGEPPKVDFTKHLVLLAVRRGSVVSFAGVKLDNGNLTTNVVVTPDMPGYQTCAMVVVDRKGVQKVNGRPIGQ